MKRLGVAALVPRGARGARYVPEFEMRRPQSSSKMYRSVQDWKPITHELAHSRGSKIENDAEECTMLYMMLVDHMGYRWPVRFKLEPGMTLWDVVNMVDPMWFKMVPDNPDRGGQFNSFYWYFTQRSPINKCRMENPNFYKCQNCIVTIPYEYLDAMAPLGKRETQFIKGKAWNGNFEVTGNMRVACQTYVESWMDGMTVVLPQQESYAFQMYTQQGTDRESVDSRFSIDISNMSDNYSMQTPDERKARLSAKESALNAELARDRGESHGITSMASASGSAPLREIFWMDNVDDIIRVRYPDWKGRYEFLNK